MARAVPAALAALALAVMAAGCAGGGGRSAGPGPRAAAGAAGVLALLVRDVGSVLARLRPLTLQPVAEVRLARASGAVAWSPDGFTVAVGTERPARLVLADPVTLRVHGELVLGAAGSFVGAAWWPTPARLLALVHDERGRSELVAVDPRRGEVASRVAVEPLFADAFQPLADGLVAIAAPEAGIGPPSLLVVRGGQARAVRLARIRAGARYPQEGEPAVAQLRVPDVVADPEGRRAYVFSAGDPVAEVDLASLAVSYHEPEPETSLLARLLRWLEPEAQAKASAGPWRQALWLPGGRVAVAGWDRRGRIDAGGVEQVSAAPAGLTIVDPRRWTARAAEGTAGDLLLAGGTLLAFGAAYDSAVRQSRGIGLAAYDFEGRRRWHRFGERPVSWVQAAGGLVYALFADGGPVQVVDLATGETVAALPVGEQGLPLLLAPDARS